MTQPNGLTNLTHVLSRWAESLSSNPRVVHLMGREPVRLRYVGRKSGRTIELPAWAKRTPTGVLVQVGQPDKKKWWRNFRHEAPVRVLIDEIWRDGRGVVQEPKPGHVEVNITWV